MTSTEVPTELVLEQNKTFPGHGQVVLKVFDTKSKKATVVKAKLQSKELVLTFDASNEEDITSQFKVKRATKEYATAILDRISIVMREGQLRLDFDWTGIRRIQIEAAIRAEKLAEQKRKAEEDRIAKEKRIQEEKIAEQERLAALAREEALRIQREKEAEELRKRMEEEERTREARQRRKAFEDKIGNAMLNGGVMLTVPKTQAEEEQGENEGSAPNVIKTWSDEHRAFYYTDLDTNVLTWRDPSIESVWEKLWDADLKAFKFVNKMNGETLYEEPYLSRYDKIWVEEQTTWYYVHKETGDTSTKEPYY